VTVSALDRLSITTSGGNIISREARRWKQATAITRGPPSPPRFPLAKVIRIDDRPSRPPSGLCPDSLHQPKVHKSIVAEANSVDWPTGVLTLPTSLDANFLTHRVTKRSAAGVCSRLPSSDPIFSPFLFTIPNLSCLGHQNTRASSRRLTWPKRK
jgi:hypothetical protein